MSLALNAHEDAVAAIDRWLTVSKQTTSLGKVARAFVDDVQTNSNTKKWSKVDVQQILPFKTETPRLLLVVRAGAMFLPILLTWLALSQVIGPFSLFLQNQQASANFLWFWQTNPGDTFAEVWKLSHVALTDAAILAFLTVLAMRITWWETSRAERSEVAYAQMLSALEFYLVSARES
ncbi:MAG: hypothetical protein RLZ18_1021 [Actinomycetota bacterium]|jgi:hypothetical protein